MRFFVVVVVRHPGLDVLKNDDIIIIIVQPRILRYSGWTLVTCDSGNVVCAGLLERKPALD
jgi:hypothetical protein